jgi:hypothetical protein
VAVSRRSEECEGNGSARYGDEAIRHSEHHHEGRRHDHGDAEQCEERAGDEQQACRETCEVWKWVAGQLAVEANPPASVSAVIGCLACAPKMRPRVEKAGS